MLKTFVKSWGDGLKTIWRRFIRKATVSENKILLASLLQLFLLFAVLVVVGLNIAQPLNNVTMGVPNRQAAAVVVLIFVALGYLWFSVYMLRRLQRQVTSHTQFLSDASHELRTPLTIMKTQLELALRHQEKIPPVPTMEDTLQEVNRMQRIVEDLLFISKDYLKPSRSGEVNATDIQALLKDVQQKMHPFAKSKNVRISYTDRLQNPSCWVRGDEERLREAFLNIVRNSIDYSKPSGGSVLIELKPCMGKEVVIDIKDTGIGIPAKHLPNIFNRFYQVDKSRALKKGGGSGLGLPITKLIIESAGGTIAVTSKEDYGTTTTISLRQA